MSRRFRGLFGSASMAAAAALAMPALASPMVYTARFVSDVKLGSTLYPQASLTFKFIGDTANIDQARDGNGNPIPSAFCSGPSFFVLSKGRAKVYIESQGQHLSARFQPSQVFVALDTCNGGIGFGSFVGPNGLEPAYPLAFTLGTAMSVAVNGGLAVPAHTTGNAWACVGYPPSDIGNLPGTPDQLCIKPDDYPLATDHGGLIVYMPYHTVPLANHIGTKQRGSFSIEPHPGGADFTPGDDGDAHE